MDLYLISTLSLQMFLSYRVVTLEVIQLEEDIRERPSNKEAILEVVTLAIPPRKGVIQAVRLQEGTLAAIQAQRRNKVDIQGRHHSPADTQGRHLNPADTQERLPNKV